MAGAERRGRIGLVLRIVGTVVAITWTLQLVQPGAALAAFSSAPVWVFFVPPTGVLLITVIQAYRVKLMLRAMEVSLPLSRIIGALCRGAFVGLVLPSGGQEVAKAAFLVRTSGRTDAAIAGLLAARVLQLPSWALLMVWGLSAGLLYTDPLLGWSASVFLTVVVGVLGLAGWGLFRSAEPRLILPGWIPARLTDVLQRILVGLRGLHNEPGAMLKVLLLALLCAALNLSIVWTVLHGFDAALGVGEVAALVPAADVLIWMPVSIGGLGVREGLFAYFLAPRGVASSVAVAIGLTRWTGELTRAGLGGILFVLGDTVSAGPSTGGRRSARDG